MKKPGQPHDPLDMTAGRITLLAHLRRGVADAEMMAMAANWIRDLSTAPDKLKFYRLYRLLNTRSATTFEQQVAAAIWIEDLILIRKKQMNEPKRANDEQPGGDHYKSRPVQHWDFVSGHDYGYLEGQITKYLFRWRDKGGLLDVQKADHFLRKLREVRQSQEDDGFTAPTIMEFIRINRIPPDEANVMIAMHAFHETRNPEYLEVAAHHMAAVLALAVKT